MRLDSKLAKTFLKKKKTIAVAESCTGGLLSNILTNSPGASAFFWLGIVAYDNKAKIKVLKIPSAVLKKHGAVSLPAAELMAQNVRQILKTDFGIGITGIAGPSGGTKAKPVGLVFIAVAAKDKTISRPFHLKGSRLSVKNQAAQNAMDMLLCVCS